MLDILRRARRSLALATSLALPVVAGGCRTRPWDLIRPDEVADAGPDLSLADLFVPPDFAPPADLILPKVCRSIYTVDSDGRFAGFEPRTLQFTDLPRLRCPTASTPQTMSVARDGTAWVFYSSHELFFVNTENSACRRSGFDTTQIENNSHYGSAFSDATYGSGRVLVFDSRTMRLRAISQPSHREGRPNVAVTPSENLRFGLDHHVEHTPWRRCRDSALDRMDTRGVQSNRRLPSDKRRKPWRCGQHPDLSVQPRSGRLDPKAPDSSPKATGDADEHDVGTAAYQRIIQLWKAEPSNGRY